ncbi:MULTISPECIES: hypothetical protein [Bacillaceae]|uniref:Uncharacterized protein n=1 Tax=Evansella alkalicola TaxID=745819 RepID=A0ABS6K2B5_9BACI|nr:MULTISPECIES: hypothetical protein [Bacillaceae]MBU9723825.1 hypothetical protein [Bacillus alkalicola]
MFPTLTITKIDRLEEFINEWAQFYQYNTKHEYDTAFYEAAIQKVKYDEGDITKLFLWKNGTPFSEAKKAYVSSIEDKFKTINAYKVRGFTMEELNTTFPDLSDGIWKIFLLHIIDPLKYPIFDQHVYRAYMYIKHQQQKELPYSRNQIMNIYLEEYVPYINDLFKTETSTLKTHQKLRKLDRALFAFGRFLKSSYGSIFYNQLPGTPPDNESGDIDKLDMVGETDIEDEIDEDTVVFQLPEKIRGRSIHSNVIPTVCNIKNMLDKLVEVNGDVTQLKQWEKRSYYAYKIDKIKDQLLQSNSRERVQIIRNHILQEQPGNLGASCIDIYLVAYVSQSYGPGKSTFFNYIKTSGISDKENTAQAIWQVGKGDGVYLNILHNDGTVRDWGFTKKWVEGS